MGAPARYRAQVDEVEVDHVQLRGATGSNKVGGMNVPGYDAAIHYAGQQLGNFPGYFAIRCRDQGRKPAGYFLIINGAPSPFKDLAKISSPDIVHFDNAPAGVYAPDRGHTGEPAQPQQSRCFQVKLQLNEFANQGEDSGALVG